ncbi:MAG: hypothetical protein QW145_01350 [Candidatus Bathyarchaeia archaeon]
MSTVLYPCAQEGRSLREPIIRLLEHCLGRGEGSFKIASEVIFLKNSEIGFLKIIFYNTRTAQKF